MIVADKANKLVKRCKTNNPFEICNMIGIEIVYADIGSLKLSSKNLQKDA